MQAHYNFNLLYYISFQDLKSTPERYNEINMPKNIRESSDAEEVLAR